MSQSGEGDGQDGAGGKEKLVITPGGPRRSDLVHEVKPGQTVYLDQAEGYIVADQLVLTPGGFRSKSLVHHIDPGHGLRLDHGELKKVELATRKLTSFPPPFAGAIAPPGPPQRRVHGATAPGSAAAPGVLPALGSGWITYAWWDSGATPITSFSTTWVVPQAPSTYAGQTIFLFNGIQNTGANFGILQPVLQYGPSAAGGGNYWSIASWYVTSTGQAFHTTLIPVSVGQSLVGVMNQTGHTGDQYSYNSLFQGIANTTLPVENIAPLHWANETLEAYSINQCSDYPAASSTAFTGINIAIGATHPTLHWRAVNAVTDCGQHAVVVNNANPGGEVDLFYTNATPLVAVPGWFGSEDQGADIALADINGNGVVDLVVLHIDNPGGENHGYYRIGWNLGASGAPAGGWSNIKPIPGWFGAEDQGAGLAIADINGNGRPDLVVFHIDNPGGENHGYYRIGWNLDTAGNVTGGWSPVIAIPGWFGAEDQGGGIAVADLDGDGRPELVVFHLDNPGGENHGYYRVGRRLDTSGNVTGGWGPVTAVPGWFGSADQGAGIAIGKLGANTFFSLVVFHVDNPGGENHGYYRTLTIS